jgi:hypothetical protein
MEIRFTGDVDGDSQAAPKLRVCGVDLFQKDINTRRHTRE